MSSDTNDGATTRNEWSRKYGDIDPYEDDEKPAPSQWPDDEDKPHDTHGRQYNPYAGSQTPTRGRCNAPLRFYEERYGEMRYCTQLPERVFLDGDAGSRFCRTHKSMEDLMERHKDLYEHGGFATSHVHVLDKVSVDKQAFIIDLYDDLLDRAVFDYDVEYVPVELDTSNVEYIPHDELTRQFPVPNSKLLEASRLFMAACDSIRMLDMQSIVLDKGPEGSTIAAHGTAESGTIVDTIEEKREHHLNLPLSRLTKDHTEHLEIGGVIADEDETDVAVDNRSWTLHYGADAADEDDVADAAEDADAVPDMSSGDADGSGSTSATAEDTVGVEPMSVSEEFEEPVQQMNENYADES